jgi:hypothetical protein
MDIKPGHNQVKLCPALQKPFPINFLSYLKSNIPWSALNPGDTEENEGRRRGAFISRYNQNI